MEPTRTTVVANLDSQQIKLMRAASYASVAVAIALIALKFWAWYRTDSVALLSSLADSLLDLVASLITLFAVKIAVSPADREHRFGGRCHLGDPENTLPATIDEGCYG